MARPRSILGLLFHLVVLYVRRRPVLYGGMGCALLMALLWHATDRGAAGAALQVGVLRDGFVVSHPADAGRRVIELDPQGAERRVMTVQHAGDQRVVGTGAGTAVAWQQDRKVRLVRVEDDRDLGTWGKSVRQLCDGVASNRERFAVGWLESDDSVWIVHGPVATATPAETEEITTATGELVRSDWCGVASAEQNVGLFWRTADRLRFVLCGKRKCSGLGASVRLERRLPVLGIGCLSNVCLIAVRDDTGTAQLALLTESGRTKWVKPLDTPSQAISIVGVGNRRFAIGYAAKAGAEVVQIDRDGAIASLWRDAASTGSPALAWSSDRLLIAHHRGDALIHATIPLPR